MKIIMMLGTGILLTFPTDRSVIPDCFSQGYSILQKVATYQGPGPDQAWILKGTNIEVGGWYCR
jgi:hypothetical protein